MHARSLVAALASYLDARAHDGRWLVRIEDIDEPRTQAGAAQSILYDLQRLGMHWESEVVWQSQRKDLYRDACERLNHVCYPCACTRREIQDSASGVGINGAAIYPGTCRNGLLAGRQARSTRLRVPEDLYAAVISFQDRWQG